MTSPKKTFDAKAYASPTKGSTIKAANGVQFNESNFYKQIVTFQSSKGQLYND